MLKLENAKRVLNLELGYAKACKSEATSKNEKEYWQGQILAFEKALELLK